MTVEGDYRYERKFLVRANSVRDVILAVRRHPAAFHEIYHQRRVNNIYLDTPDWESLHDNADGVSERTKVRVRWYGATFASIASPTLERKIRSGSVGRKEAFPLPGFTLRAGVDQSHLNAVLGECELPIAARLDLKRRRATLLNCYQRRYFRSRDGKFRVTVDWSMASHPMRPLANRFLSWSTRPREVVVELKYARGDNDAASAVSSALQFRLSKNSKYALGMLRAYPFLR